LVEEFHLRLLRMPVYSQVWIDRILSYINRVLIRVVLSIKMCTFLRVRFHIIWLYFLKLLVKAVVLLILLSYCSCLRLHDLSYLIILVSVLCRLYMLLLLLLLLLLKQHSLSVDLLDIDKVLAIVFVGVELYYIVLLL
jgi:hypothetical protein